MIENIKRIAFGYRTLMAVVVGILVILILYWWFCCKDGQIPPSLLKITGGFPDINKTQYVKVSSGKILSFKSIGMDFVDPVHKFYVLNHLGESYVLDTLNRVLENHIEYICKYVLYTEPPVGRNRSSNIDCNLRSVFKSPLSFFGLTTGNTETTALCVLRKKGERKSKVDATDSFDFAKVLRENVPTALQDKVNEVLKSYRELCVFMNDTFGGYLDEVTFIGQPTFFAEPINPSLDKTHCEGTRFSKNMHFVKKSNIYQICEDNIRKWYTKSDGFNVFFDKYYYNNITVVGNTLTSSSIKYYEKKNFDFEGESHFGKPLKTSYDEIYTEAAMRLANLQHFADSLEEDPKQYLQSLAQQERQEELGALLEYLGSETGGSLKEHLGSLQRQKPQLENQQLQTLCDCMKVEVAEQVKIHDEIFQKAEIIRKYRNDVAEYSNSGQRVKRGGFLSTLDIFAESSTGSGKKDEEKEKSSSGDFADIYPALKLFMMVFMLFGYRLRYITTHRGESIDDKVLEIDYFKMMASYVIYAHLFNTFCCVRMEPTWNQKIGNLYVYNFVRRENKTMVEVDEKEYDVFSIKHFINAAKGFGVCATTKEFHQIMDKKTIFGEIIRDRKDFIPKYFNIIEEIGNFSQRNWYKSDLGDKTIDSRLDLLFDMMQIDKGKLFREESGLSLIGGNSNEIELLAVFTKTQKMLLDFFSKESDDEENFQNVVKALRDFKIIEDGYKLILFLCLVNDLASLPRESESLYKKIENIILLCKDSIGKNIPDKTLIDIFGRNKRLLLHLLTEKILNPSVFPRTYLSNSGCGDECLLCFIKEIGTDIGFEDKVRILKSSVGSYNISSSDLSGEGESFKTKINNKFGKVLKDIKADPLFDENRKCGVNEEPICGLIRSDNINDFIAYMTKNGIN